MVWLAPTPCSSGGRSAVSTMIGIRDMEASITAGKWFAAAVPDVQNIATGAPEAAAIPRPKYADERSSTCTWSRMPGCRAAASAIGVDREPGVMQTCATPPRTSSSSSAVTHASATSPSPGSLMRSPADPRTRRAGRA